MTASCTTAIPPVVLLLICLGGQAWCADAPPQATPITANHDVDAGLMYPGELRVVHFLPRVPQVFSVLGVRNSCSCMFTGAVPSTLGPTDIKEFSIALKAADAPQDIRLFSWIDVRGANDLTQVLQATITGSIRAPLHWESTSDPGRGIDLGAAASTSVPVTWSSRIGHGPHPMPWTRLRVHVSTGESWLDAQVVEEQDVHALRLTPIHQKFQGVLHGRIQLLLDDQDGKMLPYQPSYLVKYILRGEVTPSSSIALIGSVQTGVRETVSIRLRTKQGELPTISQLIPSDPKRLTAEQRVEMIDLHFTGTTRIGPFHEHLDIQFANGEVLRIPVIGAVVGQAR